MIYGVIMAGGRGERFWPLSRKAYPKQFLALTSDRPLIIETRDRLEGFINKENIFVVTTDELKDEIVKMGFRQDKLIVEPEGKNTLYAVLLSAIHIIRDDPEAVIYTLPSDHYVGDNQEFATVLKKGMKVAEMNGLGTFGIKPTRPETGYGYIEQGERIEDGIYRVKRFTEKPNQKLAAEFLKKGGFLWNSGIFVWKAEKIIEEVKTHQPHLTGAIEGLLKDYTDKNIKNLYDAGEPISVDYGVMERSKDVYTVLADFPWDDIGTWAALGRILPTDENGNTIKGDVVALNTTGSILYAENGTILAEGLSNYIVVHTEDATLVIPKNRSQELKNFLKGLKEKYL